MDIINSLVSIAPHITATIAVIVPAVVSVTSKKYDMESKQQEWFKSQCSSIFFDFCSCYAKCATQGFNANVVSELTGYAYKLAALCDELGSQTLFCFADLLHDIMCCDDDDEYKVTLTRLIKTEFNSCAQVIRQQLIEPNIAPQEPDRTALRHFRTCHGSGSKSPNRK